jgi:hypothetical protein
MEMRIVRILALALCVIAGICLVIWWTPLIAAADKHEGLAAWVQAIGTIGAVTAAIYAPMISEWFEQRRVRDERRANTLALISNLQTPVIEVGAAADLKKILLDAQRSQAPSELDWKEWFDDKLSIKPPVALEYSYQWANDVDEALLRPFRQVAEALRNYNNVRFQTCSVIGRPVAVTDWFNVWKGLDDALMTLRNSVAAVTYHYVPSR